MAYTNLHTDKEKYDFLLKSCEDSKLTPITKDNVIIGHITNSEVNDELTGIISHGFIYGRAISGFEINDGKVISLGVDIRRNKDET